MKKKKKNKKNKKINFFDGMTEVEKQWFLTYEENYERQAKI